MKTAGASGDSQPKRDGARTHLFAIAIGSNIGDRRGNIAAALQKLRALLSVTRISSVYETEPVGYTDQPDFLNMACIGMTHLPPLALRRELARIEQQLGRHRTVPQGPRPIDLDLLLYGEAIIDDSECMIPHPGLTSRAFVLVPLAEIAPTWREPRSGKTVDELLAAVDTSGVRLCEQGLLTRIRRDVQESRPQVPIALNRVGICGVKTLVQLPASLSDQRSTIAVFDIYADLDAHRSGVHMSRFSQDLEDALDDLSGSGGGVSNVALALAERVVASQRAERAEVAMRAPLALARVTPASAIHTHEFYTVVSKAVVTADRSRKLLGVEAEGMTACPCAQTMVADYSRERLLSEGFSEEEIAKVLAAIPVATHNQRARGALMVGSDHDIDLPRIIEIVEQSMSSETYDLLKRPDELFIVNKAHSAPRFVEDAVREMLRYAHDALAHLPDADFVLARQISFESIHKHDAVAESCATLGELRRELRGHPHVTHTTLEQWLDGNAAARPSDGLTEATSGPAIKGARA
ncbi:MAG: 2-amino-4-hydroxy-6-hydroxymethyldihydropteridine pyrophosphokinase [Candidatus Eremiobacter antarcticus]|nr:GTP cyclohydrolase I FolE2 [Candidatus Eremiobacteraeota bacterium]MBC5808684.1 GTP cyclohydrolase I FolE2 [Candidatus Eremiobacteraeota bacterium]PZR62167.1 MAG: 2-amino-4-hydroxy-6-hydroxymethyldihydropteridine pyrophosphokinase [Candidatus Eremiobacter sp. RRmetagenome_bin22]